MLLPACMSVRYMHTGTWRGSEPPYRAGESNPGPLRQQVFLTTKSTLQFQEPDFDLCPGTRLWPLPCSRMLPPELQVPQDRALKTVGDTQEYKHLLGLVLLTAEKTLQPLHPRMSWGTFLVSVAWWSMLPLATPSRIRRPALSLV